MATGKGKAHIFSYQVGRLLGYLFVAVIASIIGSKLNQFSSTLGLIAPLSIGGIFIYWGVQTWRQKPVNIRLPKFFKALTQQLWKLGFKLPERTYVKSITMGSLSLFLPCGLLYGVLFGLIVLNRPDTVVLGIFAFWLGTLPAMLFAPHLIQNLLRPLQKSSPKLLSLVFISFGVITVSWRFLKVAAPEMGVDIGGETCH